MSSEWPVVTVDEVCELIVDCVNKTAPVIPDATPFRMIRTTNVRNGRIDLKECRYVGEETYEKWTRRAKLQPGDVILTREAPIGEVGLVTEAEGVFLGQRLMQYRANPKLLDPRYLLYSFLSPALQHQFGSHEGSGSVVSHIRVGDCFKFKLKLPPLHVQREVAATLGAIDDRITLLRETNDTLKAIAQALFKSWFVDFDPVRAKQEGRAPEGMDEATAALFPDGFEESALGLVPRGWKSSRFQSLIAESTTRVGNLEAEVLSAVQTGELVPSAEHFNKRVHSADISKYKKVPSLSFAYNPSRINIGSIGLNERGHLGAVSPVYVVVSPISKDSAYFIWHHLKTRRVKELISVLAAGTVRQNLAFKDFSTIPVVIPCEMILEAFGHIRSSIYQKIKANLELIEILSSLRDTLLPRLISGQLSLPEAEALIA